MVSPIRGIHYWSAVVAGMTIVLGVPARAQPAFDPDVGTTSPNGAIVRLTNAGEHGPTPPAPRERSEPLLLGTYPAFDYWSLDTSGVRDSAGLKHFGVRLWEYNNQVPTHDRYVLDSAGNVVATYPDWLGIGGMPAFTDGNGHSHFVRPVATAQYFGTVDSAEHVHAFYTVAANGWDVAYAQFDENGATIIDWTQITVGADAWNWYLQPVVTSDDKVIVTWIRDTEDVCAVSSEDGGYTWSDITVLVDCDPAIQHSMLKTVVGADDSLHLVWRTLDWSTYDETLRYAKLRSDWSIAVDETVFRTAASWYPFASLDNRGILHVTFSTIYDTCTSLYYTRLRGDLDLGGSPATEELLTVIPQRVFISDPDTVRYPVNLPDDNGTVHVVYEEGGYGRGTDKDLYYITLCGLTGDLNCDDTVNISDLGELLASYDSCVGDAEYNANADIYFDGCVNISDLAELLPNYGATR